jgi:ribosomal protein S18 acetylase RimI-like enzyme
MRFFRPVPRVVLAVPEDAPALAELLARCGPVDAGDVESWLQGGFEVYRATLEGRLVGMVRCAFPTGACVIDQLVVVPEHRRRGFGQYLAEHAVSRARRAGAPRVWVQAPEGAEAVLRLFRKLGFRDSAKLSRDAGEVVLLEMAI